MNLLNLPTAKLLALVTYGEAKSEGISGMTAVLNVIKNRAREVDKYGDSGIYMLTKDPYKAVILKPMQFSALNLNTPSRDMIDRIAQNFEGEVNINSYLSDAYRLSILLLKNQLRNNIGSATYYHADYVLPSWMSAFFRVGSIGRHIFYSTASTAGLLETGKSFAGINPTAVMIIGSFLAVIYLRIFPEKSKKIIKRRKK